MTSSIPPNEPDAATPSKKPQHAPWRSKYRSQQHDSAHADTQDAHTDVFDHPLVPKGKADIVLTNDALAELVDHLRAAKSFAYDSEFIGELSYHPKLCLIQCASATRVSLIDPLSDVDLTPFWELLCDPAVEKIVHAGEQDIEPVLRNLRRSPVNLFDTQICAGFVGMAYPVSLLKLVNEVLGVRLGKGLTFTHWDQRPLSSAQLRYAADDVRYLPAIHAELVKRLSAAGHLAWARAESNALADPTRYKSDPSVDFVRIRGASSLHAQGMAILRELAIWRDRMARQVDAPPRAFLKDEILVDMAKQPIKSIDKLAKVRGLPRPIESEHGQEIVELTLRAIATPIDGLPNLRTPEPTPTERFRADALFATVQILAAGRGIDPALLASRQDIGDLGRALPDIVENEPDIRLMKGWRREAVGENLLGLLSGKSSATSSWANGSLRTDVVEKSATEAAS